MGENADIRGLVAYSVLTYRTLADAGDRLAAGWLADLLAGQGDHEGAVQVWAQAYGDDWATTRRLAELLAEQGDQEGAAQVWRAQAVRK